jgi:ferredoxin
MRVTADVRRCQGYANCVVEAPDVFDFDDASGKVTLLLVDVGEERRAEVERAIRSCPVHALELEG